MDNNTIFDLQQSRRDWNFITTNMSIELDVAVDIFETAKNIPYIGSLLKLGQVAINYIDYRFFQKLGKFLKTTNEMPEAEINNFIANLSHKDRKRISDYLTQLLYTVEDDKKVDLMGKIYKRRVCGEIDNDMMLRLCSIVSRAYITDLDYLADYQTISESNTYITDNLVALGLLADEGNVYEKVCDEFEETGFGPTKHRLNLVGQTLYQILMEQPIAPISHSYEPDVPFQAITNEEIDSILTE